jgi:hypothetical protein
LVSRDDAGRTYTAKLDGEDPSTVAGRLTKKLRDALAGKKDKDAPSGFRGPLNYGPTGIYWRGRPFVTWAEATGIRAFKRFCSAFAQKFVGERIAIQPLRVTQGLPRPGLRQKSAFAQPINYSGSGTAIPEECKISQKSQVAPVQIAPHPGAHQWWLQQFRPQTTYSPSSVSNQSGINNIYKADETDSSQIPHTHIVRPSAAFQF